MKKMLIGALTLSLAVAASAGALAEPDGRRAGAGEMRCGRRRPGSGRGGGDMEHL